MKKQKTLMRGLKVAALPVIAAIATTAFASSASAQDGGLEIVFSGLTPYITGACMQGDMAEITGIENIDGELVRTGGGQSTFGSSCIDVQFIETNGEAYVTGMCMTPAGDLNPTALSLVDPMAPGVMDEVASYPDC